MTSIICGNCKHTHASIFEVRACHKGTLILPVTKEGMYLKDGVVYKVVRAFHGSNGLYAKELTKNGFVYAGSKIFALTTAHRMSLEQAKEYGALYGVCCVCGTVLTDEKSIAAGIGPTCAKRF